MSQGLSEHGAKLKWDEDLKDRSVRKEQVRKLSEATGKPTKEEVTLIYVPCSRKAVDTQYKD